MALVALFSVGFAVMFLSGKKKREGYMTAGALDHLDSLDPRYEFVEAPDMAIPTEHFADIVDAGDHARLVEQPTFAETAKPLERLERLQDTNRMPMTAAHLPQYNIDVANPATYSFSVSAPRVQMRNRLAKQADLLRGDVPITYHPDMPVIVKSRYGRDTLTLDGLFSDTFKSSYNRLTGRGFKNMPLKVNTEGILMD